LIALVIRGVPAQKSAYRLWCRRSRSDGQDRPERWVASNRDQLHLLPTLSFQIWNAPFASFLYRQCSDDAIVASSPRRDDKSKNVSAADFTEMGFVKLVLDF
jgi:hypothetical protein